MLASFSPDTPTSVGRSPTTSLSPKDVPPSPKSSSWNREFPKTRLRLRPGKEQNLTADQVKQQVEQDASLSPEDREKALAKIQTIVLAYNRRVDITSKPTGQESAHEYPFKAEDFARLVDRNGPAKTGGVEMAAQKEKISKKEK